jgi:hypothetical protein
MQRPPLKFFKCNVLPLSSLNATSSPAPLTSYIETSPAPLTSYIETYLPFTASYCIDNYLLATFFSKASALGTQPIP